MNSGDENIHRYLDAGMKIAERTENMTESEKKKCQASYLGGCQTDKLKGDRETNKH